MYTKNYLSEVILRIDFVEQKKEFNIENNDITLVEKSKQELGESYENNLIEE